MNVLNSVENFVILSPTTGRVLSDNCQLIKVELLIGDTNYINRAELPKETKVFDDEKSATLVLNVLADSYDDEFLVYRLVSEAKKSPLLI